MGTLINNLQDDFAVTESITQIIKDVVQKALATEKVKAKEVSIALVDDQYIKELNQKYRDKNEATDVLSFPQNDEQLLGDIIISLPQAKEQSSDYNHSFAREIGFLTVHGMLHLIGYDHYSSQEKKVMRTKEEEILDELNLTRE